MVSTSINDPRSQIDAIDDELLRLINRRAEIALRVGAAKSEADVSLCDPNREAQVLARLRGANAGPIDDQGVTNIFQRIIDESLLLQQQTYRRRESTEASPPGQIAGAKRVAILGERGTFSEEAALGILGEECETVSRPTFEELFASIENGDADLILSPLENSLIGSVHRCVGLLLESRLNIIAEIVLPVSHFLIGCDGSTLESIESVESHPAALAQCTRFFAGHPNLKRISSDDTAGSVRRAVADGDITRAAIGSRRAAEIYGGTIIREHIEDHVENYTRFVLLSDAADAGSKGSKITLVLRLKHQPGALHAALRPFVRRGIDLLKIESLPIKESPGEFNFYLDIQAPPAEAELTGALEEVRGETQDLRLLGRYSTTRLASAAV